MRRLVLAEVEIVHLPGGNFRLDGGTMFGVVPKDLWQRESAPDAHNRIRLACNCLLLNIAGERILLDTGVGERCSAREREIYGIDTTQTLRSSLATAGLKPTDITMVAFTHLHFDHFCGSLIEGPDGLLPLFPNAIHVVQRGEWHDALAGRSTMKSSYRPADLRLLQKQVELRLVAGTEELAPGLETFVTGGHTEAHQGFRLAVGDHTLVYPGELLPTRIHMRPYWNMAYDMFPHQTLIGKQTFLEEAAVGKWIVAWDHDPQTPWSRIAKDGDKFIAKDPEEERAAP
ncbi:MAG: MBL fold metallo-hydrolase [Candidatus Latescibacterota bacterium]|nr:MBL fold metallo-hydrolase [Candidatus Latescibacterota bacterium]